jgi:hypothetical protein
MKKWNWKSFLHKQNFGGWKTLSVYIPELAYIKQLGNQDVANRKPPLAYETYMELLLSECSSYDKKLAAPANPKQFFIAVSIEAYHSEFGAYTIDTDVSKIMTHVTNTSPSGNQSANDSIKLFVPWDQWNFELLSPLLDGSPLRLSDAPLM